MREIFFGLHIFILPLHFVPKEPLGFISSSTNNYGNGCGAGGVTLDNHGKSESKSP